MKAVPFKRNRGKLNETRYNREKQRIKEVTVWFFVVVVVVALFEENGRKTMTSTVRNQTSIINNDWFFFFFPVGLIIIETRHRF